MVNVLQLAGDEKVTTMIPVPADTADHYLVMATRSGMIKKTPMEEFQNLRKSGLIAIVLREDDELVSVELTDGKQEVILASRLGKSIRFNEAHIRAMGRASMGVRSMKLAEEDVIMSMARVEKDAHVLTLTANGYGKRTDPDEYREQGRNGKGVTAMNLTDKTGPLTALLMVKPDEDLLLITDDGTIIRTRVDDIRICGRSTQGVRLMRVADGCQVVGVARAEAEEAEEAIEEGTETVTE